MVSVTARASKFKQPRGGFIPVKSLDVAEYDDGIELFDMSLEELHPTVMGMVVDYLHRQTLPDSNAQDTFRVALSGAFVCGAEELVLGWVSEIEDLDPLSAEAIALAATLVQFDGFGRGAPGNNDYPREILSLTPEAEHNIHTMVQRSVTFFRDVEGGIVRDGFVMPGGYTEIIDSGDGDFITARGLWDMKVSKNPPTNKHTLQLAVYWRMGLKSVNHTVFTPVEYLGIFNPRLNKVYKVWTNVVSDEVWETIDTQVIGYQPVISPV